MRINAFQPVSQALCLTPTKGSIQLRVYTKPGKEDKYIRCVCRCPRAILTSSGPETAPVTQLTSGITPVRLGFFLKPYRKQLKEAEEHIHTM